MPPKSAKIILSNSVTSVDSDASVIKKSYLSLWGGEFEMNISRGVYAKEENRKLL